MDVSGRDKAGGRGAGVGGRLRKRFARMLLHSSCAATSATAFVGLASAHGVAASLEPPPPPQCAHEPRHSKPISGKCQRQHRRRGGARAALVHISIDCSARSVGAAAAVLPSPMMPPARDSSCAAMTSATRRGKGKGSGSGSSSHKLRSPPLYGWSSSTDTDAELAPFSSEEADATRFSSRSFSSDSTSDFYYSTNGAGGARPRRHRRPPRRAPKRDDAFRPTPTPAAGTNKHGKENKLDGGTAVVKQSLDPYADFRSSMAEMVAGRRIRGADALSELLAQYLSLNSPRHHPAILAAFEDVWEAVLGDEP